MNGTRPMPLTRSFGELVFVVQRSLLRQKNSPVREKSRLLSCCQFRREFASQGRQRAR